MRVVAIVALTIAVACSQTKPTPRPAPVSPAAPVRVEPVAPAETEPPLVDTTVAGHHVVVNHEKGRGERIEIDGATLFPRDCETATDGLCSKAHRAGDHVTHQELVAERADQGTLDLVFKGTAPGNTMCATFTVWRLHVDGKGARVGAPAEGCFGSIEREDVQFGATVTVRLNKSTVTLK